MPVEDDPTIPGRTHIREAGFAGLHGVLTIGIMGLAAHWVHPALIFPSLGPTAFLIFANPTAAAASPRNALVGHVLGAGCGLLALAVCGLWDAPPALTVGVSVPRALAAGLSLGGTSALMIALRRPHPPAGATTLIVSLGLLTSATELLALHAAVVTLLVQGYAIHRLAGTRYPHWANPET